ncbi:hypothetical protein [Chryseobacterium sp.]|uniref:hypothetical protein n=1 Tax=Chryseobacterium sp. TaxID=1871047 RepID=UPI002FC6F1F7
MLSKQELKTLFENGDIPRQEEFWQWQDSYFHKDENIPPNKIDFDFSKKADLVEGKIPASQLPSYVDDVLEYNILADFPQEGESGKIYIEISTGKQYRWSGTRYTEIIDTSAFDEALKNKLDLPKDKVLEPGLYNYIPLINKDDQTKKIISNDLGKYIFKNIPTFLSEEEKASWKSQMNGGWTTNTMSVAYIMPSIADRSNKSTWFTLKGANLNLNPENFSITLSLVNGNLIYDVANNQVQLYQNGVDLTFYLNCSNLVEGEYKVIINNGVASYTTQTTISVKNSLQSVDLSNLQWDKKLYNNAVSNLIFANGNVCSFTTDANVKPLADDHTFIAAFATEPIINANQDFILKGAFNMNIYDYYASGEPEYYFGLMNAEVQPQLSNQAISYVMLRFQGSYIRLRAQLNLSNHVNATIGNDVLTSGTFSFMRRGNTMISSLSLPTGTVNTIETVTQGALKFGMFCQNNRYSTNVSAQLHELILL